jgi:hypothetical protein
LFVRMRKGHPGMVRPGNASGIRWRKGVET